MQVLKDGMHFLREKYHPLFRLRKTSLYRKLTKNTRISVAITIDPLTFPIYIDLLRNTSFFLSRSTGETFEINNFKKIIDTLEIQVFWDVGANVGIYSFLFCSFHSEGQATLFEPDPENISLLEKTLKSQPKLHCTLIRKAVSDQAGTVEFALDELTGATGSIKARDEANFVEIHHNERPRVLKVETTSLDIMAQSATPPDMIKIDVEGAEELVMAGAHTLIATARPAIMFEADSKFDLSSLRAAGYEIFDMCSLQPVTAATHNNLALHREKHTAAFKLTGLH